MHAKRQTLVSLPSGETSLVSVYQEQKTPLEESSVSSQWISQVMPDIYQTWLSASCRKLLLSETLFQATVPVEHFNLIEMIAVWTPCVPVTKRGILAIAK
jgi:hypothetical protein